MVPTSWACPGGIRCCGCCATAFAGPVGMAAPSCAFAALATGWRLFHQHHFDSRNAAAGTRNQLVGVKFAQGLDVLRGSGPACARAMLQLVLLLQHSCGAFTFLAISLASAIQGLGTHPSSEPWLAYEPAWVWRWAPWPWPSSVKACAAG